MASLRERLEMAQPYVLFVGTLEPRKNVARLIRAFASAVRRADLPHDLVIAGGRGWKDASIVEAFEASGLGPRVRFVGYVDDADVPALYGGAELFVFPSLDEGFGLPPLEAMACGTPVVTSRSGALPEVVGDAAVLIDPLDETSLAAAIERLLGDQEARANLAVAGLRRAARFDWKQAATDTMAVYAEAAS